MTPLRKCGRCRCRHAAMYAADAGGHPPVTVYLCLKHATESVWPMTALRVHGAPSTTRPTDSRNVPGKKNETEIGGALAGGADPVGPRDRRLRAVRMVERGVNDVGAGRRPR